MIVERSVVLCLVVALITEELSVAVISGRVSVEVGPPDRHVVAFATFKGNIEMDLILVNF